MRKESVKALTESALMVAFATILSMIKIIQLPYGGSVTIASMLPVAVVSYRRGLGWGFLTGVAHGIVQQLLGLKSLSYVTTWQSVVAVIFLDYILAFAVTGIAGIFRNVIKNQATALTLGSILACLLRYVCHVIAGATVWAGLPVPTAAAMIYSLSYNATYMLPETIVTAVAAAYAGTLVDFGGDSIRFAGAKRSKSPSYVKPVALGLVVAAALADAVFVFSKLQDESGEFSVKNLSAVNWKAAATLTGICVCTAVVLAVAEHVVSKKEETK